MAQEEGITTVCNAYETFYKKNEDDPRVVGVGVVFGLSILLTIIGYLAGIFGLLGNLRIIFGVHAN